MSNSSKKWRICIICGIEYHYIYKKTGTRYCSENCKRIGYKKDHLIAVNEYIGKNPNYAKINRKTLKT